MLVVDLFPVRAVRILRVGGAIRCHPLRKFDASLHSKVVPFYGYSRVRTSLAFVRLEKPITLRAFLWSSSSNRFCLGSIPLRLLTDSPEPPPLPIPLKGPSGL
jgi:hypothetical protein